MAERWLYEALYKRRPEVWLTVGYMKLCVDRDLNCGRYLILPSLKYLKSQGALCQAAYDER